MTLPLQAKAASPNVCASAQSSAVMMRMPLIITYISVPIAGVIWTIFAGYRLYEAYAEFRGMKKDPA